MNQLVSVWLPAEDRVVLNTLARENERSVSAEARLAIRRHLAVAGGVAVLERERDDGEEKSHA